MAQHNVAYSTSEQQRRYAAAVGPNKMFGTGDAVVRCYRLLAAGSRGGDNYQINEALDILQAGIVAAVNDSFETSNEE